MPSEVLGVAPFVILTAIIAWITSYFAHREKKHVQIGEQAGRMEIHRDDLTLQIIRSGREELTLARVEMDDLREEIRKLRGMESHFYHFQQSLDHLEALLTADTDEARIAAERNARAFLQRMRRLAEAKGTMLNEAQRMTSGIRVLDRENEERDNGNVGNSSAA